MRAMPRVGPLDVADASPRPHLPTRPHREEGGLPWPAARAVAAQAAAHVQAQGVPLKHALGHRLGRDLTALTDLPVTTVSAMDGWAVRGPGPWRFSAGASDGQAEDSLAFGQCQPIATGAPVPPGTDAVLPVEHSILDATPERAIRVSSGRRMRRGQHVRAAGEEARRGDLLLPAGRVVTPAIVGLAAATGYDELVVADHVPVELFVLGDEIIQEGLPGQGHTRDALGPQLPSWIARLGGCPTEPEHLRDEPGRLIDVLSASQAALTVTTGGTSVGRRDYVRSAVKALGGRLLVDGVQVKPGHPMLLAELSPGRLLIGLPGNPLAACVALMTLAQPLLATLTGKRCAAVPQDTLVLTTDQPPRTNDVHRLVPARRSINGHGEVLQSCGSAMLRGLAEADSLLIVPPSGALAGDAVAYLPLPWQTDSGS